MGKTLILAIDELAPNQVQAFATVNDALAAMEAAENSTIPLDMSNPVNYTVAELDFVRYWVFEAAGHAVAFDMVFPALVNTNPTDRTIAVKNYEAYYVTVTTDDPGATVVLPPFTNAILQIVGGDVRLVARGGVPPSENDVFAVDMSGGDFTVDATTYADYGVYRASGNIAEDALSFPGDRNRVVTIINDGGFDLLVDASNPLVFIRVPPGQKRRLLIEAAVVTDLDDPRQQQTVFNFHRASVLAPGDILSRYTFVQTTSFLPNWLVAGIGSVTFTAQPDDTDTITINDGVQTSIFEFDSGGGVTGANIAVVIGASFDATGRNLQHAINNAPINVMAYYDAGTNVCTIKNLNGLGGSISATSFAPDFTFATFAGGINGTRGSMGGDPSFNEYYPIQQGPTGDIYGVMRISKEGMFSFFGAQAQTGSILFNAQVDDGDIININDGFMTVSFEFDNNVAVTAGNILVTIGGTQDLSAQALRDAIMISGLNVEAIFDAGTNTISLNNWNGASGAITKTDADNDMTVTNFSGGVAAATKTLSPGQALTVTASAALDSLFDGTELSATFVGR